MSKYSSFGKLNGGNSVNLLPYKSRYFRFWKLSPVTKTLTFFTLFLPKSKWLIFTSSFNAVGSARLLALRFTVVTSLASSIALLRASIFFPDKSRV